MSSAENPAPVRYVVDAGVSRFTARAFATGVFSAMGHNPTIAIRGYTAEAQFAPDSLQEASLKMQIDASALSVQDDIKDQDRREIERMMREQVLETGRFPEIIFQSTEIAATKLNDGRYAVNVTGDLTLHGVTNRHSFTAQVAQTVDILRAYGEFTLRQSDFRIKPVSVAGGTLKLKDELKFAFDVVARKQG